MPKRDLSCFKLISHPARLNRDLLFTPSSRVFRDFLQSLLLLATSPFICFAPILEVGSWKYFATGIICVLSCKVLCFYVNKLPICKTSPRTEKVGSTLDRSSRAGDVCIWAAGMGALRCLRVTDSTQANVRWGTSASREPWKARFRI